MHVGRPSGFLTRGIATNGFEPRRRYKIWVVDIHRADRTVNYPWDVHENQRGKTTIHVLWGSRDELSL